MNFCIVNSNTIKYMTNKAVEKSIEISGNAQDGTLAYQGFSTTNYYELICRTSLFEEIFGTFPNQYVAITDTVLKLPLEQQPWFFGNISNDEAEAKLTGNNKLYSFYIYFSKLLLKQIYNNCFKKRCGESTDVLDTISGLTYLVTMEQFQTRRSSNTVALGTRTDAFFFKVHVGTLQRWRREARALLAILQINREGRTTCYY